MSGIYSKNCVNFLGPKFLRDSEGYELRPVADQPVEENTFIVESEIGERYKIAYSIEQVD